MMPLSTALSPPQKSLDARINNILFFSPHFPPHFVHFISALRSCGCNVVAIGDCPYDYLDPNLKKYLHEYYYVQNMEDYNQVYRATGLLIHNHGRIGCVVSHNEHWLSMEGRIRDDFNIKYGYSFDTINKYQKKSYMKTVFEQQCGAKVAKGRVVNNLEDAMSALKTNEICLPAVIKPDTGVGAIGAFKINKMQDVHSFFDGYFKKNPQAYLLEEFVEAEMETFDGLTDRNGNVVFCSSSQYGSGLMETVLNDDLLFYFIRREVPADLKEMGLKIVKAFEVKGHFFHFEFFRTKTGQLIPLEVNLRLFGGYSIDMWNYAYDLDMYREWATITSTNTHSLNNPSARYFCVYAARKFRYRYRYTHEQIMGLCTNQNLSASNNPGHERAVQMMVATHMPELFRASMGDFYYMFRSADFEQIKRVIAVIQEKH